jgi:hypothetical protein
MRRNRNESTLGEKAGKTVQDVDRGHRKIMHVVGYAAIAVQDRRDGHDVAQFLEKSGNNKKADGTARFGSI